MKQIKSLLFVICILAFCQTILLAQEPIKNSKAKGQQQKSHYTSTIFQNPDKTFGYDIFDNGKQLIHQPTIPGRPGNAGFKTKQDAQKVANLAITKMKKGLMPPTIEEGELKGLKI